MMEAKFPERLVRYGDTVFSYLSPEETLWETRMPAHVVIYVRQGILRVTYRRKTVEAQAGEIMFIRRNHKVQISKSNDGDKPYSAISIRLERNFLLEYWRGIRDDVETGIKNELAPTAISLGDNQKLQSTFQSLKPFVDGTQIPTIDFIDECQRRAVAELLRLDPSFYPTLFDFSTPWKIDILKFMEKNFMEDLSLSEIATYTGRSFATFKRDFAKLCDITPEHWITNRRLKAAYDMLTKEHLSVNEAYRRAGFKNRSHFSNAFKQMYGISPSMI